MSNWTPTNELRFVERKEYRTLHPEDYDVVRILQQKWGIHDTDGESNWYDYEWRDVPVEREECNDRISD